MSEYKGIKGFQVQTRTEDPVPYAQAIADNPYAGSWAFIINTARNVRSRIYRWIKLFGGSNGFKDVANNITEWFILDGGKRFKHSKRNWWRLEHKMLP